MFMLGLGAGGYFLGAWADRTYARRPEALVRQYGVMELAIGALGVGLSVVLPRLGAVAGAVSSYARTSDGWYVLSPVSFLAQLGVAAALLAPSTVLMGGTLTVLVRHLVGRDLTVGRRRIATLYAVNTAGAAAGAFATDFVLVPWIGLRATQLAAASLNGFAAVGALGLALAEARGGSGGRGVASRTDRLAAPRSVPPASTGDLTTSRREARVLVWATGLALALAGVAGMGIEILWVRHLTIVLGQFRAVFSLLLTVILLGIAAGSLLAGRLVHRGFSPLACWALGQGLFVVATLGGLVTLDGRQVEEAARAALHAALAGTAPSSPGLWEDLLFNVRPIVSEVGVAALLMGFGFPLANAVLQRADALVGRRAGWLYLGNTAGAVGGALATGFVLLPGLGLQGTAAVLACVAGGTIALLAVVAGMDASPTRTVWRALGGAGLLSATAVGTWLRLPPTFLVDRAVARAEQAGRRLALEETVTEVLEVVETDEGARWLFTNGHPMASTTWLAQRYMRALAHVPLLCLDRPESVLVIGFGVGNTVHAVALHRTVRVIEVAELSEAILRHADAFFAVNRGVLKDPRVRVFVHDGRHHLRMRPAASFDLVTLEPPPVGYAGVAALYSREFYELVRGRLKPGGYVSQWLPAYQVPAASTLAMIRAFVDVFPQAVLLSGAEADLILLGVRGDRIEIDPSRVAERLARAPAVRADLERVSLGRVHEVVGMFVGSAGRLAAATRAVAPVIDDRPIQEYVVRSLLAPGEAVPAAVVDLDEIAAWCPSCFAAGEPVALVRDLRPYLALLDLAYRAPPDDLVRIRRRLGREHRILLGSRYLGAVVPESATLHAVLGLRWAERGALDEAIAEFQRALALEPTAPVYWHLGAALAARGDRAAAVRHLSQAIALDPANGPMRYDLASVLLQEGRIDEAVAELRQVVAETPGFAEAHARLGVALAAQGALEEAASAFRRALELKPELEEARRGLARMRERARGARDATLLR